MARFIKVYSTFFALVSPQSFLTSWMPRIEFLGFTFFRLGCAEGEFGWIYGTSSCDLEK